MQLTPVKVIRYAPWAIFGLLCYNIIVMTVWSFEEENSTISFHAQTSDNFIKKARNEVVLGENKFVTGIEGEVYWKAKSFKEVFILSHIVASKWIMSALDVIWYFIFSCILYWMVYDIKAENLFSKKVFTGAMVIWFFLIFSSLKEKIHKEIADYFLNDITHGQFEMVRQDSHMPFLICLFPVLLHFIQKAQKAEDDQNLTV